MNNCGFLHCLANKAIYLISDKHKQIFLIHFQHIHKEPIKVHFHLLSAALCLSRYNLEEDVQSRVPLFQCLSHLLREKRTGSHSYS